jgi:DNA adenine methylase
MLDPLSSRHDLRPPLKWAGGKRWLVPHLSTLWDTYRDRRLVEPFCGGLAVALGLQPAHALLNDINPHVVNFYSWLQRGLTHLPFAHPDDNASERYYKLRDEFNAIIASQDGTASQRAAELFYYLNRTGYNGLCRFNRKGKFNTPFGKHKTITYNEDFTIYSPVLAKWDFQVRHFSHIELRPGDFVYADPPYDVEFTQYSSEKFGWEEQVMLANWLARHSGPVVASNQATPRILELYTKLGFTYVLLPAPRRISRNGDRKPAMEMLAYRNVRDGLIMNQMSLPLM